MVKFQLLERMRHTSETLARKLNMKLAHAALAKRLQSEGREASSLGELEVQLTRGTQCLLRRVEDCLCPAVRS